MKVLICMADSKYIHSSLAPWCLRAGIKSYCEESIEPVVFECTVNEKAEDVISRIVSENADVIGFCCYIWNIGFVKKIAQEVRKLSSSVIVFGGPEVSYNPNEILNDNTYIDYVLSGEGEETFAALCHYIDNKENIENVRGLSYRTDNGNIIGEPYSSCKEPVSPYCDEYFNRLNGRIAYIEASRGCPFTCGFCLSGRCGGLIFYNLERVKKEILLLSNSSAKTVKFIDRTFNANPRRCNEILNFIADCYGKEIPNDICFHFEIAGDILNDSTMQILSKLPKGAVQLEVGLQSFNEMTLEAVKRKPQTANLTDNIKKLISFGNMHIHIDLIAGLPCEDIKSFENSFNKAYFLYADMLQLGFLKLLYGSYLRDNSSFFGCEYSKDPPYEVIKTYCLSEEDICKIHYVEDALERLYNSGRFRTTLLYLTEDCKMNPFKLFLDFGEYTKNDNNIALDNYVDLVYNFFKQRTDEKVLRDKMVIDRLQSNSSGVLPECLKIPDKHLKVIKKQLRENVVKSKGKIAAAILYSENKIVYSDYSEKDKITGNYKLYYINGDTI